MRNVLLLLAFVFGFAGTFYLLSTLAPSNKEEVAPPPATIPVEITLLVVGDAVTIDGLTVVATGEVPTGKIVLVEDNQTWINLETMEEIQARAITVEFVVNGDTAQFRVPESIVKRAK